MTYGGIFWLVALLHPLTVIWISDQITCSAISSVLSEPRLNVDEHLGAQRSHPCYKSFQDDFEV